MRNRSQRAEMMLNCMNTGTGALTIAGIRLADAALAALLLVLLATVAAFAVVRLFFDHARRFSDRFSRST